MIVNPQVFNYRLIIGSLIVAMAVLAVFSFSKFESLDDHQTFMEEEKKLVESELSQMISQYDELASSNDYLASSMLELKKSAKLALDSLRLLKGDISVISKFKSEVLNLKEKNDDLLEAFDSLNDVAQNLENESVSAKSQLKKQLALNSSLQKENLALSNKIKKAAILTANSFNAKAYKISNGDFQETKRAQKAQAIEVCFTLAENALTEKGQKELYIQIVNPKNNVVADKGSIEFGDSLLIYSTKTTVNYENKVADVCTQVISDVSEQPLTKGTYFVSVFHDDMKLGTTQVVLD